MVSTMVPAMVSMMGSMMVSVMVSGMSLIWYTCGCLLWYLQQHLHGICNDAYDGVGDGVQTWVDSGAV